MNKSIEKVSGEYKHYVYREIGLIKGYKLTNETNETDGIIINDIKIEINMESESGRNFYAEIENKFRPEELPKKYVSSANYIYSEREENGFVYIAINILTNKSNKLEVKAKKKLIHKINKYT